MTRRSLFAWIGAGLAALAGRKSFADRPLEVESKVFTLTPDGKPWTMKDVESAQYGVTINENRQLMFFVGSEAPPGWRKVSD